MSTTSGSTTGTAARAWAPGSSRRRSASARRERGCAAARLETWDFQAPGFYQKQGYEVVCVIPDYPPGITEYTLVKRWA